MLAHRMRIHLLAFFLVTLATLARSQQRFAFDQPKPASRSRFVGFHRAGSQDADYIERFRRPRSLYLPPKSQVRSGSLRPEATNSAIPNFSSLPGFGLRASLPAGNIPTGVAVGDFNRDGKADFVVSNGYDNNLYLYLGHGDGTFDLPHIIPLLGESPLAVAAADLRGTGKTDLVVAEADSGTVGVLLGNGDGTFGTEAEYSIPGAPDLVTVGDFNNDGKLDIVSSLTSGTMNILAFLPADGTGVFGAAVMSTLSPWAVTVENWSLQSGEVNGDGKLDVMLSAPGSGGSRAFLNDGTGHFTAKTAFDGNSIGYDLTGATLTPLTAHGTCLGAAANNTLGYVHLFQGNCNGTFTYTSLTVPTGDVGASVSLRDVNGDGTLDLVSTGFYGVVAPGYGSTAGNLLSVGLGKNDGTFGTVRVFRGDRSPIAIAFGDFNGDGAMDIVTSNEDSDSVTVFLNDLTGNFGDPQGVAPGPVGTVNAIYQQQAYPFADINGDGSPDMAYIEYTSASELGLTALLNDGHGHYGTPIRSDLTALSNHVGDWLLADFRGTGHSDFLAVGQDTTTTTGGQYILYARSNGDGTFGPPTTTPVTGACGRVTAADINGDGKLDLVTAYGDPLTIRMFLGNGDGTFNPSQIVVINGAAGGWADSLFAGDFNGDGTKDIVVHCICTPPNSNSTLQLFALRNISGTLSSGISLGSGIGLVQMADLNRDGRMDLVEGPSIPFNQTPQVRIRLAQPDITLPVAYTYTLDSGAQQVAAILGDFNDDGNVDIVDFQAPPGFNGDVYAQILAGNGDGSFTPTYDVFNLKKPRFAPQYAYDVNGDGRTDLIEIDGLNTSFHVLFGQSAPKLQLYIIGDPVIGTSGTGRVSLDVAASTDTAVQLSASDPGITLPTSVTVAAGQQTADFTFSFGPSFDATRVFQLRAQLETDTATASSWKPPAIPPHGFVATFNPTSGGGPYPAGSTFSGTVYLKSAGGYSTVVQLSCDIGTLPPGSTCQLDTTSAVLSGTNNLSSNFTFAIGSGNCTAGCNFQVVADDGHERSSKTYSISVSSTPVTVVINQAAGQFDPTTQGPIHFAVVFSEAVTGFSASGVSAGGTATFGTQGVVVTGSGSNYEVTIDGMSGPGTVIANLSAGAATSSATGVQNQSSTSTDNVVTYVIKKRRGQVTSSQ